MYDLSYIEEEFNKFKNPNFHFDEPTHKYTLNGDEFISSTTIVDKHFKNKFDSNKWSKIKAKQRGISQEEILLEWKEIADYGKSLGTACHYFGEMIVLNNDKLNNIWLTDLESIHNKLNIDKSWLKDENYVHRIKEYLKFYKDIKDKIIFLNPELLMFHPKWKIAGTMDIPFIRKSDNRDVIYIGDYKFNKQLKGHDSRFGKNEYLRNPFNDIYSNDITAYSIQLSIYGLMVEEMTNLKVGGFMIFHFGENSEYKIVKCYNFMNILRNWFNQNRI